jgi:hypothetical protein
MGGGLLNDTVDSAAATLQQPLPDSTYESTSDGTLYWTLSLYIDAARVKSFQPPAERGKNITRMFRKAQLQHYPSFALRNAIDPLFNDIADRERLGKVQDFLLAAGIKDWQVNASTSNSASNPLDAAAEAVRTSKLKLTFHLPAQFSWVTEGELFSCRLAASAQDPLLVREVDLRRFWFAHSDGALSYHLSFSHYYGDRHGPQTYYFLSLLQKLAVPKEFSLSSDRLREMIDKTGSMDVDPHTFSVFDDKLGIDPLDLITVRDTAKADETTAQRFWPFVKQLFSSDAVNLFADVLGWQKNADTANLLDSTLVDVIEVPGLRIPRSRSLFHIQDARFFKRLLPQDGNTGLSIPRKRMVQESCYKPYQQMFAKEKNSSKTVVIGEGARFLSWDWLINRTDYKDALADGWFCSDEKGLAKITDAEAFRKAMHGGECWQVKDVDQHGKVHALPRPVRHHAPAYEPGRTDCIDYLFLAGFNQNIIDWLNQDTSEILDSTDPIYPTDDDQTGEAFFVRFANHRALITYVAQSRSLEVGNDYIGTCPYAFLIHILTMHNEFLSRGHEERAAKDIEAIGKALKHKAPNFEKIENQINELKAANYEVFETHRYLNVFRYDTERDVFAKLEQLRGVDRRNAAVMEAIGSLEDKSSDLEGRRNSAQQTLEEKRGKTLNYVGIAIGWVSAVGLLFSASEYIKNNPLGYAERLGLDHNKVADFLGAFAWISSLLGFLILSLVIGISLFGFLFPSFSWSWFSKDPDSKDDSES